MSRRRVLLAGGAGLAVAGLGAIAATSPSAASGGTAPAVDTPAAADACYALSPELIDGPYYLDYNLFRNNLVEDRTGIPLTLRLNFTDVVTCAPLPGAAVDIWSCDGTGVYSGYVATGNDGPSTGGVHQEPTDDFTFLRGSLVTDANGAVEFNTLFPGWYQGRAVHIHVKVHVGGELTPDGYESGHVCHTGQLFFAEEAVLATYPVPPYNTNTVQRTTLDRDRLYAGGGAVDGLLDLSYDPDAIQNGVVGSLTMGVDSSATP